MTTPETSTSSHERIPGRVVGVYNANGGLKGELSYVIGKLKGTTHCGLCDITHGNSPVAKKSWKDTMACLPVDITTVHLNEMDSRTAALVNSSNAPAVVFLPDDQDTGDRILLDAAELDACAADPEKLGDKILAALTTSGK
ncbi:hypothetical protein ACFSSC_00440 [Corynebacterium mendelii]|uniref:Uncharacterized protein n=1 Tax=Corynebacterium mendelii TaxID=2765362 RepID=A0A939DZM6_9CORY|nr:hypothetical protein [Corynebacterium mendelii]MBN9643754.1 hypothetical protein [Corynebacterium mendelii]